MPRKLTTIVAADIAGFSRLIGLDEEGTLAELRAQRSDLIDPLIDDFAGRLANTAGDSLLLEFPSAVEAVRFAVALQDGMAARTAATPEERRIAYRIGINLGDVVSQGDDLLGDGVNVAARLEALAPPGGILVSRTVRDQVRDRLELNLRDLGRVEVKNIARPVHVFQILKADETPIDPPRARRRWLPVLAATAGLALALAAGAVYWHAARETPAPAASASTELPLPDKPSIVVLPFVNQSGAADQDYFVDGFTTAINTYLSKFPQLFVIADMTASTYKGSPTRAREVGRELGVRYVLAGSLARSADRLTLNAQLIEAESEHSVWAERYDVSAEDLFSLHSELVAEIVSTLRFTLEDEAAVEVLRRPAESLKAYDLYLRSLAASKALNREATSEGIALLEQALALDDGFLAAHAEISGLYLRIWRFLGGDDPAEALRLARFHGERALEIDARDYRGHYRLGTLHLFADHEHDLALAAFQRALDDNPNDADLLYMMGFLRSLMGAAAEAITWNDKAKRINPRYPGWYDFNAALSHWFLKDYARALALAKSGIAAYPKVLAPRRILIATLVETDRLDEARTEADAYLAIRPSFRLSTFRNTPFQHAADQDRYFNALRAAGLPD